MPPWRVIRLDYRRVSRSGREAAIATLQFGLIERGVGPLIHRSRRVAWAELGESAGDRGGHRLPMVPKLGAFHRGADLFSHGARRLECCHGQQQHELLATD